MWPVNYTGSNRTLSLPWSRGEAQLDSMLIVERRPGTLLLTLDRPDKGNALHPELIAALAGALTEADADHDLRAVVITGAGKTFCAGLDLGQLTDLDEEQRVGYMRSAFELFRQVHELRQPVIAAVNGPAFAGGFDLAAFCDLRFCGPSARFAQTEILLGLTQILYPLYKIIGLGRAKELAFTGDAISSEEAYRIGLVNRIVPDGELVSEALRTAEALASRPAEALFETKRLSRDLIEMDTAPAMEHMFDAISVRLRSEEHRSAVRTYTETLRRRRAERGGG